VRNCVFSFFWVGENVEIILSDGEFCDFWNSDFGWTPTEVDLVGIHPKNINCVHNLDQEN
jgi:hypothetical protein